MSDIYNPDEISTRSEHFVAGEWMTNNDEEIEVLRPSDRKVQGLLCNGSESTVDQAVTAAHMTYKNGWGTMAPRERAGLLRKWADLIDANAEEIARLESSVSCRVYTEVVARDVRVVANCLRFFGEYADKVNGDVTSTSNDVLSLTMSEPWGVVAGIVPWNFPLILSAWKFAPAMAAGNCVVLKPSELTPFSIARVAELSVEAGIPRGVFNIVQGVGGTVGAALVKHPLVNYITFTGSTATGAQVMSDAALNGIKPVSLELGGKGPQVVFADAPNMNRVAALAAIGATYNSGQVCFAGSRLIVEECIASEFLDSVLLHMKRYQAGATWNKETTLPPVIHDAQVKRIHHIVESSIQEGGELLCGGGIVEGINGGSHYKPTLINGVTKDMTVFNEEVFGPVLAVQTFANFEEAMDLADHPTFGLAASVHTTDINKAIKSARTIQAGTIWINDWGRRSDLTSPFGGYKQSGIGKDMGLAGYQKYRKTKSVWIQS